MARKIGNDVREMVRRRAKFLCEYCHTNEHWQYVRFTVDHVIPNNDDLARNLALACFHCNRRKSNKTSAIDSETNEIVQIFNTRRDVWKKHFVWSSDGLRIVPQTPSGRATVKLLELNRESVLLIRKADVAVNRHPPIDDLN